MRHRFVRNLLALVALVTGVAGAAPLSAQRETACEAECYTAQQAREDLTAMYDGLQAEHVDLFARRSQAEYDAHVARLLGRIEGPVARRDLHLMLHDLAAFGNIGHAKTEVAFTDALAHLGSGGEIIPLSVTYRDATMLTDQWPGSDDTVPPGSRITRIGDLSLAQFEARMRRIVSADTDRLLRAQIELSMPVYLFNLFGALESLPIGYIAPDGREGTYSIAARSFGETLALWQERPVESVNFEPGSRDFRDLGEGVFYLRPGPFSALAGEAGADGDGYAIADYAAFVEEGFAALEASGARHLLIDLRGNPGGDASFSDLILTRLVEQPYRFASHYAVRAGPNTKAAWADREADAETLSGRIAGALAAAEASEVVTIDLPQVRPAAERYGGRVWVLVDRMSFSNAAVVAGLVQDLGIGTILGEETADLATTYGAVERFTLPHSGAEVIYPKAYMVRLSGDESVRGVVPDFPIAPNRVGEGRDIMLETALAQIRSAR